MAKKDNFLEKWELEFNSCNEKTIYEFASDAARKFYRENNCNRQFPMKLDGLKPVYRRVLIVTLGLADKLQKTAKIVGETMGSLHPHGDSSISPVVSEFVGYGVFDGQGQHGVPSFFGNDTRPAAMRYTEAKLNKRYRDMISPVMEFVPYKDGELEEKEPEYIPTPIPYAIRFGSESLGSGVNGKIPALDAKSLHEAMLTDDFSKIESGYGLEIIKEKSELEKLWNMGEGKLTFRFPVKDIIDEAGRVIGVAMCGKPKLFKPRMNKTSDTDEKNPKRVVKKVAPMSQLKQYADEELITITENSKEYRLEIRLNPRIKKVSITEIRELAELASVHSRTFKLMVTDGNSVFKIPLKYWLKECYDNYVNLISRYKEGNLEKLRFEYRLYELLPKAADLISENKKITEEQLAEGLGVTDMRIVKAILAKTLSQVMAVNNSEKLNSIQMKIDKFTNIDPVNYTEDVISKL